MLYARKPMSIGDYVLAADDVLTNEVLEVLPVGRLARLVAGGYVVDRPEIETLVSAAVEELFARVEELEQAVATALEGKSARKQSRPDKGE